MIETPCFEPECGAALSITIEDAELAVALVSNTVAMAAVGPRQYIWQSSDNALNTCCDAVRESAACLTTVQRVEANELSRVAVCNAGGIPAFVPV